MIMLIRYCNKTGIFVVLWSCHRHACVILWLVCYELLLQSDLLSAAVLCYITVILVTADEIVINYRLHC